MAARKTSSAPTRIWTYHATIDGPGIPRPSGQGCKGIVRPKFPPGLK